MFGTFLLPVPSHEPWWDEVDELIRFYCTADMDQVLAAAVEEVIIGRPKFARTYFQEGVMESMFQIFEEALDADLHTASNPYRADRARVQFNDRVMRATETLLCYYDRYRLLLPGDLHDSVNPLWLKGDTLCIEINGDRPCHTPRQYKTAASSFRRKILLGNS